MPATAYDIKDLRDLEIVDDGDLSQKEGVVMKHDNGADEAAAYADYFHGEDAYSRKEETSLRWKIDTRVLPILFFNVILGATDKVSHSTGALYGMREDTHSTGDRYSWVGSSFYFGYLLWCFPAGSLLQRTPIAKMMSLVIFCWGVLLIGLGFARNYPTVIAIRVLLGILEAPIVPGGYLILSMWYTRTEQTLRAGLMYTNLSVFITGPVGYALGSIGGGHQWKYYFYILGGISIIWAAIVGIFLPDSPTKAKLVTERQKAITVEKLRADQTGVENKMLKKEQVWEALLDPKTWLLFFFNIFCSIPNGGLTNFQALIIKGMGYSSRHAVLLTMPEGVIATTSCYMCSGAMWYFAKHHPKLQMRTTIIVIGELVGMIASVFLYTLPTSSIHSRLAALWMAKFFLGPYVVHLTFVTANTAGHTKKVTTNAIVFIAYCISNIIAPQFFKSSQAPTYPLGMGAILGSYVLAIITIMMYSGYCYWENCRRDKVDASRGERVHEDTDFKDVTDGKNVHFRYVW